MKNTLYHSLLNRLKNKHTKLSTRFHRNLKDGEFQKQRYRHRKNAVERLKSLEKRIAGLSHESGIKTQLKFKHWAVALALGAVVATTNQVKAQEVDLSPEPITLGQGYLSQFLRGDLDSDGDIDAIVFRQYENPLVLLNEGGFNFLTYDLYENINAPNNGLDVTSVLLGDFDGDGDLDLVVEYPAFQLGIFHNNGDATFNQFADPFSLPGDFSGFGLSLNDVIAVNVDDDADDDLITKDGTSNGYSDIRVLKNSTSGFNGPVAFDQEAPQVLQSQFSPFYAETEIVIDIDGDTDVDVVYYSSGALYALKNDGAGVFSQYGDAITTTFFSPRPEANKAFDFDNDGDFDIAAVYGSPGNFYLEELLNDGDGNFSNGIPNSALEFNTFSSVEKIRLRNDGFEDLLIQDQNDTTFFLSNDDGNGFGDLTKTTIGIRPADIDDDGDDDVFTEGPGFLGSSRNNGNGSFSGNPRIFNLSTVYDLDTIDIDGDSDLDIVTAGEKVSRVWLNNGSGSFSVGQEIGGYGRSVAFGDLDGDLDPDLVIGREGSGSNSLLGFEIWRNDDGVLTAVDTLDIGNYSAREVFIENIDADADLEIITFGKSIEDGNYLRSFDNGGSLSFSNFFSTIVKYQATSIDVGDIDGDSNVDVFLGAGEYSFSNSQIFLNTGSGNFAFSSEFDPSPEYTTSDVDLIDFDGDLDLDLLTTSQTEHRIFLNEGGVFTYLSKLPTTQTAELSTVGDIDGDGDNDIILGGYQSNPVIFLNDGLTTPSFMQDADVPSFADEYTKSIAADIDNDGDKDIIFGGYYTGLKLFLNNEISTAPEINLQGNGENIASGDDVPDAGDGTDFGTVPIGSSGTSTFTIQNTGDADLNISDILLGGENPGDFSITEITTPAVVEIAGSTTFNVVFDPQAEGSRTAEVQIANDDSDEANYTFLVGGVGETPAPEINIQGNGIDIVNGDDGPGVDKGTEFGGVTLGSDASAAFTIQNTGSADLTITDILPVGPQASDFAISGITLPATIEGGLDATFTVTFTPSAEGIRDAGIQVTNDDSDEANYTFAVRGTGQTSPQEINIQGNSVDIVSGDDTPDVTDGTDFGTIILGTPVTNTFTIQNTGGADLNVSGISLSGDNDTDFTVSNFTPGAVSGGADLTFDVTYDPASAGTSIATLEILSDDSDESSYTFDLTGAAQTAQEINLQGNSIDIANGDLTPDTGDRTDFGSISTEFSLISTFTIQNLGEVDLTIDDISISGTDASDFAADLLNPTPFVISGGSAQVFDVIFSPSTSGIKEAVVNIASDDPDDGSYTFGVTGEGLLPQEINVQGNSLDIASGDDTPDVGDGTDFGDVTISQSVTSTFTIQNTGDVDLNVTTVALSGANASDFTVDNISLPTVVAGSSSITFDVTYTPTTAGVSNANIDIASDDADEGAYSFSITGSAQNAQEINIQGNGVDIATGDDIPDVGDGTDLGNVTIGENAISSFTIQNTGDVDLNINSILTSGVDASEFVIGNVTTPVIVPGGSDITFDVTFTPVNSGESNAAVDIVSDDSDEGLYTFSLVAVGQTPQEINVQGNGIDIADGDNTTDITDGTDLGTVEIGNSVSATFTIQNLGEVDLDIDNIALGGASISGLSLSTPALPATIAGGSFLTFNVDFTPEDEVENVGTIQITSNDGDESPYSFDVSARGLIPLTVEADSAALVAFFNSTGGSNWTDNTNWTTGNVIDWFGVTLNGEGNRVIAVDLPSNGLSGTIPAEIDDLDALETLDLAANNIDNLDTEFTGLTSATEIDLSGNKLDFGDLEPVVGVPGLIYANQQDLDQAIDQGDLIVRAATSQALTTSVSGTLNQYQWTFNGENIEGATESTYAITDMDPGKVGTYGVNVSNSIVIGLTLGAPTIEVQGSAVISVNALDEDTNSPIAENVNAYLFPLDENVGDTVEFNGEKGLFDISSTFSFPEVLFGNYLLAIESVVPITDGDNNQNPDATYVPTFFGNVFSSEEADVLALEKDSSLLINMVEFPEDVAPGEGSLGGTIEEDFGDEEARIATRRRAKRRKCGLRRRRTGGRQDDNFELFAYGETNDQGEFEFGFLPQGTYRFFVEYPGIPLDPDAEVEFVVGEAGVSDDTFTLQVFASPEGIEIEFVLGLTRDYFTDFNIYPNPTADILNIEYSEIKVDQVIMEVIALDGQILYSKELDKTDNNFQYDTALLKPGMYVVRFRGDSRKEHLVYRIIKK